MFIVSIQLLIEVDRKSGRAKALVPHSTSDAPVTREREYTTCYLSQAHPTFTSITLIPFRVKGDPTQNLRWQNLVSKDI